MPFDGSELGRIIEEMIIAAIPIEAIDIYSRALVRRFTQAPVPLGLIFVHQNLRLIGLLELRKRNQQAT